MSGGGKPHSWFDDVPTIGAGDEPGQGDGSTATTIDYFADVPTIGPDEPPSVAPEQTQIPAMRANEFQGWLERNQVQDLDHPDSHYDYRGAFMAGVDRSPDGHFPDTFKQHGHPTFSEESRYSGGPGDGGTWQGEEFQPPVSRETGYSRPYPQEITDVATPGPEGAAVGGFARAVIEGVPSIPLEVGKAVFGSPSAEEAADPLMRASRLARYGRVPEMQPAAADLPNPAERIADIPIGMVKAIPGQVRTVLHDPDWERKGEDFAGLAMDAAMAYGGIRAAGARIRGRPAPEGGQASESTPEPPGRPETPPPTEITEGVTSNPEPPTPAEAGQMLERAGQRGQEADAIAGPSARARGIFDDVPTLPPEALQANALPPPQAELSGTARPVAPAAGGPERVTGAAEAMGRTPEEMEQILHPSGGLPEGVSAPAQRASVEKITNEAIDRSAVDDLVGERTANASLASEGIPQRAAGRPLREPREIPEKLPEPEPPAPPAPATAGPIKDSILRLLSPGGREGGGIEAATVVRHRAGELAHEMERGRQALSQYRDPVGKLTPEARLGFMDDIEQGRPTSDRSLQPVAGALRQMLDQDRQEVQALGTGKLAHFYTDYFPHIWKDPKAARDVVVRILGKRPLEGPRSFLKKRSIVSIGEGIQHGLELATDNPLDLVLLKHREMRRYIMGQRVLADFKKEGLARYVAARERAPEGYQRLDDHVAMVFGPPEVSVLESFDPMLRQGLERVITELGGKHTRSTTAPRRPRLGEQSGADVKTRFATDVTVLEHELGHLIDGRLKLWDRLTAIPGKDKAAIAARKAIHGELRALADLRYEGQEVSAHYKDYVREKPEKIANAIHALIYLPERMADVAPTVKAKLTEILRSDRRTAPLLELKKSLVAGSAEGKVPVGGLVVKGQYWAPEPVARVLNNYLSPGLRGNPLFDAYMGVGNTLNQAQLGLSAFHLGFTSIDAAVSKMALGVEQLVGGHPIKAARSLAGVPTAPLTNIWRGSKLRRAYLKPGSQGAEFDALVEALVQGGGRVRMDTFYKNNAVESFLNAIRERRPGGALLHALPAALEVAAKPILEVVVPRQKLGVFADLARHELAKLPKGATTADVRVVMGKVWDSVDNRMGQMVYDNLFWHRALKDMAMASTRAVGWNLGTLRELGGGAADLARGRFSHRTAYVMALPPTVALIGSIITYLYTGHGPRTFKDAFLPPTGRVNEDGNEERLQPPSYIKDVIAYGRHPIRTIGHKLHPLLASLSDMLTNKDYYGDRIRNVDAPIVVQLAQAAEYLVKQWVPFGIRNAAQEQQQKQSLATKAAPFFGLTPAPRELVRSSAQQRMAEILERRGHTSRNPEEVEGSKRRRAILEGVKSGKIGFRALLDSAQAGAITNRQRQGITRRAKEVPIVGRFKQLGWEEAEDVYSRANDQEKKLWWPVLWRKRIDALKQLAAAGVTDDRLTRMRELILRNALTGPPGPAAHDLAKQVDVPGMLNPLRRQAK